MDFVALQMVSARKRDVLDRERLAAISHTRSAAKHKGRNHWRNWERRQMAADARRVAEERAARKVATWERYREEVRAFWRGLRSDHPGKPA